MNKAKFTILNIVIVLLLFMNVKIASAHWWLYPPLLTYPAPFHWDATGNPLFLSVQNTASRWAEANAAIDDWDRNTILGLVKVSWHGHIEVLDGNYGPTQWGGVAEPSAAWTTHCWTWCHISHMHTKYNSYYGGTGGTGTWSDIRGIFCQEIGHAFGLNHSNTGDCMGKGYYNNVNVTSAHNWSDINAYLPGGAHP